MPPQNASILLDAISSDDRISFYSSLKQNELGDYLHFLNEETKRSTLDVLGLPKQSVARLINTDYATLKKKHDHWRSE